MEIITDPERDKTLCKDEVCVLIGEIASLDARLRTRLLELMTRDQKQQGECDLLTVEQVARKLAVTEQYVYELLRKGGLPCVPIGKYKRIKPEDLREWIDRHRENTVDHDLYLKYNYCHGRRRLSKDTKAAEHDASRDGGPDRR